MDTSEHLDGRGAWDSYVGKETVPVPSLGKPPVRFQKVPWGPLGITRTALLGVFHQWPLVIEVA